MIIYHGILAMAMLRLPTRASDGKANLYRSRVGVGIDLATGKTTIAIQNNRYIDKHPETGHPLVARAKRGRNLANYLENVKDVLT